MGLRSISAMRATRLSNKILIDAPREAAIISLGSGLLDATKINESAKLAADVVYQFLLRAAYE